MQSFSVLMDKNAYLPELEQYYQISKYFQGCFLKNIIVVEKPHIAYDKVFYQRDLGDFLVLVGDQKIVHETIRSLIDTNKDIPILHIPAVSYKEHTKIQNDIGELGQYIHDCMCHGVQDVNLFSFNRDFFYSTAVSHSSMNCSYLNQQCFLELGINDILFQGFPARIINLLIDGKYISGKYLGMAISNSQTSNCEVLLISEGNRLRMIQELLEAQKKNKLVSQLSFVQRYQGEHISLHISKPFQSFYLDGANVPFVSSDICVEPIRKIKFYRK